MSAPPAPWLTLEEYKGWARIDASDTADDTAISEAVDAASEAIWLRAPAAFLTDPDTGAPLPVPRSVHQAGLLLANRLLSRRNSPDGVVGVSDMGTAVIRSYDADITGLLGSFAAGVVA